MTPPGEPNPKSVPPGSLSAFFIATRPPFLLAAAAPALVGIAAAAADGATIGLFASVATVVGAMTANAGANVLNDVYDVEGDSVNENRVFPFTGGSRVIQNGVLPLATMRTYGFALLAITALIGAVLVSLSGTGLFAIGVVGLLIAWAYTAPPLALASRGVGEIAVAVTYGILIPVGAAYVQTAKFLPYAIVLGTPCAALIANILIINEFPDVEADARVGKATLVVRIGRSSARFVYAAVSATAVVWHWAAGLSVITASPLVLSIAATAVVLRSGTGPMSALEPGIKLTIAAALSYPFLLATMTFFSAQVS